MRLVRIAGEQDEAAGREMRPIVLFNPRMSSGDVGLGLNARRCRDGTNSEYLPWDGCCMMIARAWVS
jgi:hypothetical protein